MDLRHKDIYCITNEYPGTRPGGIGMYIAGLQACIGSSMQVDVVDAFPRRGALLMHVWNKTKSNQEIWVHHIFPVGVIAFMLRILRKQRYVIFLHGNDFDTAQSHKIRKKLMKYILLGARKVIVNSTELGNDVNRKTGVRAEVVMPWLPQDIEEYIAELPKPGEDKEVLLVGRFVPRKGFQALIEAAAELPDFTFTFMGEKNVFAEALQEQVSQRKLRNIVFRFNSGDREKDRREAMDAIRKTRYFAMPTIKTNGDREGFGIVYLEAQYAGKPIIAVKHRETQEAISPILHQSLLEEANGARIVRLIKEFEDDMMVNKGGELREYVQAVHMKNSRINNILAI